MIDSLHDSACGRCGMPLWNATTTLSQAERYDQLLESRHAGKGLFRSAVRAILDEVPGREVSASCH